MQVNFSIEELKSLRDAVFSHFNHLKRSSEKYDLEVKNLLENELNKLEALYQRLAGIVLIAEDQNE